MKKSLLIISVLAALLFFPKTVQAGGSNVMLVSTNGGVAKGTGVNVIVTVFDPYKNKLDWPALSKYAYDVTGYEPIGVKDLELELEFVDPVAGQHCTMIDGGKTNEYGQTKATCYSDSEGDFTIKTNFKSDKPLYDGGPNAKDSTFSLVINFYPKSDSPNKLPLATPPITPKVPSPVASNESSPSPTGIDTNTLNKLTEVEKQNQEQKAQIEELMNSVAAQKQEVSRLQQIIQKIQEFLRHLF